jgi:hypothetical protein
MTPISIKKAGGSILIFFFLYQTLRDFKSNNLIGNYLRRFRDILLSYKIYK